MLAHVRTVFASAGSANEMNKLSLLVGTQLPEKYKENFEGEFWRSGVTKGLRSKRRNSLYIFQVMDQSPIKQNFLSQQV